MRKACNKHAKVDCVACASRPKRNGSTRSWRTLREQILERDSYACRVGLPGCTVLATCVDHVVPLSAGGIDHPSNLQAACSGCNGSKGAKSHA